MPSRLFSANLWPAFPQAKTSEGDGRNVALKKSEVCGDPTPDFDVFLFDAEANKDGLADTRNAETRLQAEGLLLTEAGSSAASSTGAGG